MNNDIKLMDLLIDKETLDPDEDVCKICEDLVSFPIECSTCSGYFCEECAKQKEKCPQCGKKWEYEKFDPKELLLECPFHEGC